MALVLDTGPIFAALDVRDAHHAACRRLILETAESLVIPAPVLPEVDYWLSKRVHAHAFSSLLHDIRRGAFRVEALVDGDYARVQRMVEDYADLGIGFVDASGVSIAERLGGPSSRRWIGGTSAWSAHAT
ncbi:MAG: VapC toxin family PIN domain ribonuclease [Chloroflexota bacterium]